MMWSVFPDRWSLIVIDMQNAFLKEGGYYEIVGKTVKGKEKLINNCKRLLQEARKAGVRVIFVKMSLPIAIFQNNLPRVLQKYPELSNIVVKDPLQIRRGFYLEGEWGSEIIDELKPVQGDLVISKHSYDAFEGTNLDFLLRQFNIRVCIFVGIFANVCVATSVFHAYCLGYEPVLVKDAVRCYQGDEYFLLPFLKNFQRHFGMVTKTSDLLKKLRSYKTETQKL